MKPNNSKPLAHRFYTALVLPLTTALFLCRAATAQQCDFYPIAVSGQQLSNAAPGTVLNVYDGAQPGNFGWLSWGGSPSETVLVASLAIPGNSSTYVNPDSPSDHQISIGDWVSAKPSVSNSKAVRDALDALKSVDITVPVWDKTRGAGDHAAYHVANFARVRLISYQLPGQNRISARFLGFTSCGLENVAPVVNAGSDASIIVHILPGTVTLNGSASDDGLPSGGGLTSSWTVLSGAGTVTFGNSHAPVTTATFGAEGIYVLQLAANDGELTSSDTVTVSVNRTNQAPHAAAQTITTDEDTAATITLDGTDPDGDAIAFQVITLPQFGTLSGTPPNVIYTPKPDYNGQDSFTFKVNDGELDSPVATVSITIRPVNDAPVADSISVTNRENTAASITLSGSDVEGSALTYVLLTAPAHGTLNVGPGVLASAQLTYTPQTGFSGSDSFTFKVNDGQLDSAPSTVSITVVAVNQAPDVDAGTDQIVSEPTDSVELAGVVTDDNFPGNTVTVQWSKVSGPGDVTFTNATSRTTGATFSQMGVYVLRLTATDGQFESSDDVQIACNAAPVVSAGDNQTITLPDIATLNGSATDDGLPVGNVLSVSWQEVSGPGTVIFDDAHSATTTATFSESGVYVLRLTANDSLVSRSSDVTVTVNHAPVVDAGSNRSLTNLQTVLNGTVFDDGLPNSTLTTSWSQVSGPGTATFDNINSATAGVSFSASGVYVLQLTADDSLAQTSAQVTISVNGAPVVSATSDSPINFGSTVTLNATATDDGLPTGSSLTFSWNQVSGPGVVTFADATALQTTASFSESGTYVVQFSANDSALTASANVTLIVNGTPTVNAGANQIVNLSQLATLNGSVTDDGLPNGTVTVNWTTVTGPGVVTFGNPAVATTTATFSDSGVYLLRLTANDGLASASSDVTVTVNRAPVVNAGSDQVVTNLQAALVGSVSDDGLPNGTMTSLWTQVSGPGVATFANSSSPATTVTFSASGVYVLRLTADDSLAQSSAQVTIVVDGAPVVSATSASLINLPASATLTATASDDGLPIGSTLTHVWTKVSGPGTVSFANATALQTTASFSQSGTYVIQFSASDSLLTTSTTLSLVANAAPTVNAGTNQVLNFPNSANLVGSVTDDGNPEGAPITSTWSQVSGPGTITFGDVHATTTSATASQGGLYVLRLTADDTAATNSANVTVKFNQAPVAQAQSITAPEGQATPITLSGTDPDGDALQFAVTQQPLLGVVTGTAPTLVYTSYPGTYGADSFQFYVTDGMLTSAVATVSVQVTPISRGRTYTLNADFQDGNIVNLQTTNDQLQLLRAGTGSWTVVFDSGLLNAPWTGLSWDALIPNDGSLSVSVATGHDGQNFSALQPITLESPQPTNTGRYLKVAVNFVPATTGESPTLQDMNVGTVGWPVPAAVPQWQISAGDDISSFWPDPVQLKGIIWHSAHQTAVNPTIQWSLVSGPGTVTFDDATLLRPTVRFSTNGTYQLRISANNNGDIKTDDVTISTTPFNRAPVVDVGPNLFLQDYTTGTATLQGSATDDGLPLPSTLTIAWTQLFGPGTTTFANSSSATTSATFSTNGIYVLQLSANDGQFVSKSITTVRVGVTCTVNSLAGLQAWWQANGNGDDVVNGNQAALETGATYAQGKVGGAFSFDGVNARVSVAANSNIDLTQSSNSGFSVEFWINPNSLLNGGVLGWTNGVRFERVNAGSALGDTMRFYVAGTNSGQFVDSSRNWSSAATLNKWYHYAATYDRASGMAKVYVNGVLQNSAVVGAGPLSTSAGFYMGQVPNVAGAFKGQLDEISLYSRVLNPEEIFNIFASADAGKCPISANQAPAVDAGPDLFLRGVPATATLNGQVSDDGLPTGSSLRVQWTKLSGPGTVTFGSNSAVTSATFSTNGVYVLQLAADDQDILTTSLVEIRVETLCTVDDPQGLAAWWTGNNNALEMLNGYDAVQGSGAGYTAGKVGSAFSFNGVNSYVWMPAQSNYDVGTSASGFTVEFWANPNSFQNGSVLGWANGVRVERFSAGSAAGDSMRFYVGGTNSGQFLDSQRVWPNAGSLNQWYHIALVYDRTLGQAKIYTNGVLQATGTVGTTVMSTAGDFYLGQVPGSASVFSGGLDEISIYKRPLNPEEVYSVFSSGTAGKCPEDANDSPIVYAGADLFVRGVPGTATLNGEVLDDNLPASSSVRSQWSKFSGPGTVTFGDSSALTTSATFSSNGVYVLRLTADDGEVQASDFVEVRVETLCTVEHPQGLAAWWPGNGGSDDLINDVHAFLGSGTSYTNGKVAAAFNFNGVNNYVLASAQPSYDVGPGTSGFTVEFWMNPYTFQNGSVLGWANGVRVERISSGSAPGDTLRFIVGGTNSGQFLDGQRPWNTGAALNQWYHIALTYDNSLGQAKIYTNGVLLVTGTVGTNVLSTAGDFYLGQVPGSAGFFNGGLDEISIYKRPLGPEEIHNVFASGSAGKCPEDDNQAPVVFAGPDQVLSSTNDIANLAGLVTDDGLPAGSALHIQWSKIAGPGAVTFGNSAAPATPASFSTNGVYVLQLTADDSEVSSSSIVQVRVGVPCSVSNPSGLVAFWPANGASDEVINGYHAQLGSGTTYTNGKVAAAFSFNGVNNYVWAPAQTNYDVGPSATGFTVEFWMNPNSFQNASVLGWANGVRVDRTSSGSAAGDTLRFFVTGTNSGQFVLAQRPWNSAATLNQWYHIVLTYDRAAGQAKVYTNGVLLATGTVGTSVMSTAGDFYLGQAPGSPGFFSGGLDEISLYNRPLSLSEIQAVFSTGVSGKCVTAPNRAPFVFAGGNRTIDFPTNSVTLFGAVYDDGQPSNTLAVAWNYVSGPSTVFFSSVTNPVTTITFTNTGVYTFQLTASDGQYVSNDTAVITVLADSRTAPTVAINGLGNGTAFEVPNNTSTANVVVTAAASDSDGVVSHVDLFEDSSLLTTLTVPPYTMTVSNVPVGSHTFTAVATDNDGLSTTSAPVSIIVYVDALPIATIFAPVDTASITGPTAIIGTASSPIMQSYQLLYRFKAPDGTQPNPWKTSTTGNSSVVSNTVAVFDTALLLNGIYEIQLSTTDIKGRTASSDIQALLVDQNVNLTNFMLSFSDLTIPAPGMPIQITRTYDSRDHRTNDFGVGWSLDIANVSLQKSRTVATNWFSSLDNSTYLLYALQPHRIMITMAGNKTFEFEAALTPSQQAGSPIAATRMTFTNLPGTDGTLEIDGNNRVNVSGIGGTLGYIDLIDFSTGELFNPTQFKFTTPEGDVYVIDEKEGLKSLTDTNGNTLTITTNGISHSSGVSVTFMRDSLRRIQTITDQASNQLTYGYGANGSLSTFTHLETNMTTFGYTNPTFPSLLTEITDTNGVHAVTVTPTR